MKQIRYFAIILTVILALLLTACGGNADTTATATNPPSTTSAPTSIQANEPTREEINANLIAEEKERMRLEEETRLTVLPKLPNIETGEYDIIEFGGFEWRVLDMVDDRVLLLSDKILSDAIANEYFSTILEDGCLWKDWELREYLNGEFYNSFSEADRAKIITVSNKNDDFDSGADTQDSIFLLSTEEAVRYFGGVYDESSREVQDEYNSFENRIAKHVGGTYTAFDYENRKEEYTVEQGEAHTWWLRSAGDYPYGGSFVQADGTVSTFGQPVAFGAGIRPALWMRLDSAAGIPQRSITVLPSATNEIDSLSAGDTISTEDNSIELLLNSRSVLKLDAMTRVTVEKLDAFSLAISVEYGSVLADITPLYGNDHYEISANDLTVSARDTVFVVENVHDAKAIMLKNVGIVNGTTELAPGYVATINNGEIMLDGLSVHDTLSTVALEGISANFNSLSLPPEELDKAQALLEQRY